MNGDWRSDPVIPPHRSGWDLLVIGAGTAGIVAAKTAAQFGARVLLVERDRTGGDCLWTGCVPSKALLAAAHAAAEARAAKRLGVRVDVRVDFAAVMAHVRQSITAIEPADSPSTLRADGVDVAHGTARLTGHRTAEIDGIPVRFRHALLATGATAALPPIPGLADSAPWTNESIWSMPALPKRLLVIGGGSIGCELGQAFARLGSAVSIVEAAARLLPGEDEDASTQVTDSLRADGITMYPAATITTVTKGGAGGRAELDDGHVIAFDEVLVAVGRRPRSGDLGLTAAGVVVDEHGNVVVDRGLRTSNPRIWAAGDITKVSQFTHTAGVHASIAAGNAVLGLRRHANLGTVPRVTFTRPEVAAVGVSLDRARRFAGLTVRTVQHSDVDRSVADGEMGGFTRLVLDRRGRIVGATIVGPRAGESLSEVVLAARHGLRAQDLAAATHAYPTYGDGVWKASIEQVKAQLRQPGPQRLIGALRWLRRLVSR